MTDPSDGELVRHRSRSDERRMGQDKCPRVWIWTMWMAPSLDQRPLQEIAESMELRARPRISESPFGPVVVRKGWLGSLRLSRLSGQRGSPPDALAISFLPMRRRQAAIAQKQWRAAHPS